MKDAHAGDELFDSIATMMLRKRHTSPRLVPVLVREASAQLLILVRYIVYCSFPVGGD